MLRTILAIASLMLVWSLCGPTSAQPKDAPVPKRGLLTVSGYGETDDKAKADALRQAVKEVAAFMQPQSFVATEDYVRTHVVDDGRPGKEIKDDALLKPLKEWILTYRTDNNWRADIRRHDRAENRQTLTSRVVLCLAILLLAGFGYVRLDEFTQRRYTGLLRVAGVGVASSLVAGWWWIFIQAPG